MSQLESLKKNTIIVADTGDIDQIAIIKPQDATTNPSLMLSAASDPKYATLMDEAIEWGAQLESNHVAQTMDRLSVAFGKKILEHIPGVVSTEVDARLSFDTEKTIERARSLIALYEANGVNRDRVLIKIASTWEGIKAAEALEKEGIHCNLTLLFSFAQAIACCEANVTLISPFVGRVLDWFKSKGNDYPTSDLDPGVIFVTKVYNYYKKYGYNTIVMGASFRNTGEIIELNGCDKLTISPALIKQLEDTQGELVVKLVKPEIIDTNRPQPLTESEYRWQHNSDAMAIEKLAEGIRNFAKDCEKLEAIVIDKLKAKGVAL